MNRRYLDLKSFSQPQSHPANIFVQILLFLILSLHIETAFTAPTTIKVGIFESPPLIFTDDKGNPQGHFVDIIKHIAAKENWEIVWKPNPWSNQLDNLKSGDIDILPAVIKSEVKTLNYDLCQESVITTWGIVYTRKVENIQSILDLQQKSVGVLHQGINADFFKNLIQRFDIQCQIKEYESFSEIFKALTNEECAAGVVNRVFGAYNEEKFGVTPTAIIFNPSDITFAVFKGGNRALIPTLDKHLAALKADPKSVYHSSLERWLVSIHKHEFPRWIKILLLCMAAAMAVLFTFTVLLRLQVKRRTKALSERNADLAREVEERRLAEQALRDSEERYRLVVENAQEGILVLDDKFLITFVNEQMCVMSGYSFEESVGQDFRRFIHPDDLQKIANIYQARQRGERVPPRYEMRGLTKSGEVRLGSISAAVIKDSQGRVQTICEIVDITPQREALEALQASEARYRTLFENAAVGIYRTTPEGHILLANPALVKMLKYNDFKELSHLVLEPSSYFYPDTRERFKRLLETEGEITSFESIWLDHQGNPLYVRENAKVVYDESGKILYYEGTVEDITAQKQAQDALEASELVYRSLYDITLALAKELDFNSVIKLVADKSTSLLEAHDCIVFLNNPETRALRPIYSNDERYHDQIMAQYIPWGTGVSGTVAQTGKLMFCNFDDKDHISYHIEGTDYEEEAYESIISAPLLDGEKVLGVITLSKYHSRFNDQDLNLLSVFARQAEIALSRARNQRALQESEEKFRRLVELSPNGIIIHQDGRIVFANQTAFRLAGAKSPEELLGRAVLDLVHPDDRAAVVTRMKKLFSELTPAPLDEEKFLRIDGTPFDVEVAGIPTVFEGKPAIQVVFRDITQRKLDELALLKEHNRAQNYLDVAGVMMVTLDITGKVSLINKKGCAILGLTETQIIGRNWFDYFIPEAHRDEVKDVFSRIIKGEMEGVDYYENPILTADGRERHIAWHNVWLKDQEGNIVGALSSGEDITERKDGEKIQAALYQIARTAQYSQNLPELYAGVHKIIASVMPTTNFYIALVDEDQGILSYPYFVDERDPVPPPRRLENGLTEFVLRSGRSLLCPFTLLESLQSSGEIDIMGSPAQIWLGVPLKIDNKTIGMMAVQHYQNPQAYTDRELRILEFVSSEVARAIEQKRAEDALKDSESRYRSLVATANDAIISIDKDGRIQTWNEAGERIFGWTSGEIVGKPLSLITPLELKDKRFYIMDAGESKRTPVKINNTIELIGIRKDGEAVPLELSLATWETQEEVQYTGIIRDISERQQAQAQIAHSQQFLSCIFGSLTDALITLDLNLIITSCNQVAPSMFKPESGRLEGSDFSSLLVETAVSNENSILNHIDELFLKGYYRTEDETCRRMNGETFPARIQASLLRDDKGEHIGIVLIIQEFTEERKLRQQLQQAQKMEAVGQLAGGIAHDFNNLLTVIMGNTEMMMMNLNSNDPMRQDFIDIYRAAERAAHLTQQLLAFSRKQTLEPRIISLNDVILNIDRMLRRIIGEDIALVTIPKTNLWLTRADPGQIEQVIMNLAINARDAMPKGGRLIIETGNAEIDEEYLRTHPGAHTGEFVMLAVTDTGEGMTPEIKAKIFEPFFTTKEVGRGTGLGLATVYGIIKQSGGNIWVYSESGKGTTFKVYLPRIIADKKAAAPTPENVFGDIAGDETVLVAEDEDAVREMAVRVLKLHGYRVMEARTGKDALELCQEMAYPVDIVVTDLVMPVMGGVELVTNLQKLWNKVKFLYMSGYTSNTVVHDGILEEGIPYLQKPFRPLTLVRKVRDLLDKK